MTVAATTHINFRGNAREALEFYRSVFDGQLVIMTYAEMGAVEDPAAADQVVWGQVVAHNGFRVMAYDVPAGTPWTGWAWATVSAVAWVVVGVVGLAHLAVGVRRTTPARFPESP